MYSCLMAIEPSYGDRVLSIVSERQQYISTQTDWETFVRSIGHVENGLEVNIVVEPIERCCDRTEQNVRIQRRPREHPAKTLVLRAAKVLVQ